MMRSRSDENVTNHAGENDQPNDHNAHEAHPTGDHMNELPVSEKQRGYSHTRLGWRQWVVERFSCSWFTCTQSTGGIAILFSECPKQFDGLQTIGIVVFIFNLVLFTLFTALLAMRWCSKKSSVRTTFTDPAERYYVGSFFLTIATIIICMQRFGVPHTGPWLIVAIRVLFWIYAASTLLLTTIQFAFTFHFTVQIKQLNPAMFLVVYNAMLTGSVAGSIAMGQPPHQRLPIIVAGIGYQGFGFIASLILIVWLLAKTMETGLPSPHLAPGLFITVGSVGFTILALIGNAMALPKGYAYFASHPDAAETLLVVATWASIFLWVFQFWLFAIALLINLSSVVRKRSGRYVMPMRFNNVFWTYIFPNVGFTLSTIFIGNQLESNAIQWVSAIMVILVTLAWLLDLAFMAKTIVLSLFVDANKYKLL